MGVETYWFALTVLPLILTPGPDLLLCISQGLGRGRKGVFQAVNGISLGYTAHALLASAGLAAVVAASPSLFEILRWIGIGYLFWLSIQMLRSALQTHSSQKGWDPVTLTLRRGFFTSFLNPKGLLMFFSILPQFIDPTGHTAGQAFLLSGVFISMCYVAYITIGMIAALAGETHQKSEKRRRLGDGAGGILLGASALRLATQ